MKKNTQKILLALYPSILEVKNRVSLGDLKFVVPDLTDGGFRSLIYVLKNQGVLTTQRAMGKTNVYITQHGVNLLESEFPALSAKWVQWDGKWECLVFLESPSFDKQFRYLRNLLITHGIMPLNRGVYMAPGGFDGVILSECQNRYFANVLIFSVDSWKIATHSAFVIEKYGLMDVAEMYSGVSRDVDRLLNIAVREKGLIHGNKNEVCLAYDRMVATLLEDPGFCTFYFSEVKSAKDIITRLNMIINS